MATVSEVFEVPGFTGTLILPGDEDYDGKRAVFNGLFDRRPAVIARCSCAADVAAVVRAARAQGRDLTVYGGGHSVTASCVADGAVCIDLRGLNDIAVDPELRLARVEGGATWGEVDAATQAHGLAVTGGRVSTTGVGGLSLGSGSGWLERKLGFTCDNLVRAELVTANGDEVVVSAQDHPDLFWALRGGGGNFGIVTAFHFRLHDVGPIVLGGMLIYPPQMGAAVVRNWRDVMATAPDDVNAAVAFVTAPPEDFVPEPVRGTPVVAVIVSYHGALDDAEEQLRPLREFGPPAVDLVEPMPYVALQRLLDPANPKGMRNYWTADFLDALPDDAIDTFVARATKPVSPFTQLILISGGGAIARVPEEATAFGQRTAPFNVHYLSMWTDPIDDEQNITYTRELAGSMKPWTTGRLYLNFIGDEGPGRVAAAFGPEKYARLRALKATWDPDNVFRHNQNIEPAS